MPAAPVGFRAEDFMDLSDDGFVPLNQAAEQMGATGEQVVELVQRGLLETQRGLVRPAILTVLGVRDEQ